MGAVQVHRVQRGVGLQPVYATGDLVVQPVQLVNRLKMAVHRGEDPIR
jgi:hypothetical protein